MSKYQEDLTITDQLDYLILYQFQKAATPLYTSEVTSKLLANEENWKAINGGKQFDKTISGRLSDLNLEMHALEKIDSKSNENLYSKGKEFDSIFKEKMQLVFENLGFEEGKRYAYINGMISHEKLILTEEQQNEIIKQGLYSR